MPIETPKNTGKARPVENGTFMLYGLNFAPELTGIGRYSGEMCAWLSGRGQRVVVVTSYPYYPQWRLRKGYSYWRWSSEEWHGVRVIRCPIWVPGRQTAIRRILHLLSFALSSAPVAIYAAVRYRPSTIFTIEPTSLTAPITLLAARLIGARSWLHVQDLELAAAINLGMIGKGRVARWASEIYNRLLGAFDRVTTLSDQMRRSLADQGRPAERIGLMPNWVDTKRYHPVDASSLRAELGIANDAFVILYSGAMGEKQGVECLLDVAASLDLPKLRLVLCGAGPARDRIEARLPQHPNVMLIYPQSDERFVELLAMADCHVLPQRPGVTNYVMPSKLGPMLASGRPVVMQADPADEIFHQFKTVCKITPSGDTPALVRAVRDISTDPSKVAKLGSQARDLVCKLYDKERVLTELLDRLPQDLTSGAATVAHSAKSQTSLVGRSTSQSFVTRATNDLSNHS